MHLERVWLANIAFSFFFLGSIIDDLVQNVYENNNVYFVVTMSMKLFGGFYIFFVIIKIWSGIGSMVSSINVKNLKKGKINEDSHSILNYFTRTTKKDIDIKKLIKMFSLSYGTFLFIMVAISLYLK